MPLYSPVPERKVLDMEKALILITLRLESSSNLVEQLRAIKGVKDAALIYGPYDAYATVETPDKEGLWETLTKIRAIHGVHSTLTCNAVR